MEIKGYVVVLLILYDSSFGYSIIHSLVFIILFSVLYGTEMHGLKILSTL